MLIIMFIPREQSYVFLISWCDCKSCLEADIYKRNNTAPQFYVNFSEYDVKEGVAARNVKKIFSRR